MRSTTLSELLEIARNAGNVRDLGTPGAAAGPLKSMLAERIVRILDDRELTVRAAAEATGFAAADFSRIRQGKLSRFTVDRLLAILGRLEPTIELSVLVRPKLTRDWVITKLKAYESEIRAEGATALYLFGSVARNEAGPESDVDLFVEFSSGTGFSLLNLVGIQQELEDRLGTSVDISTRDALHPRLRKRIEQSAIRVF